MNQALPIADLKDQIMHSIKDNPVTIITAQTGAGKSTQVPQWLLEAGYRVVVTQPLRLAARTVAQRVADEFGCVLGGLVGFRTAFEHQYSSDTQVLFCTDGLQMIRELTRKRQTQVLVIDEVHEWNVNIETLVAWVRKELEEGVDLKVVLMSATLESDRLSVFFNGAPIIDVPGRLFPVTVIEEGEAGLMVRIVDLVRQGKNVLVFQPGKREIGNTVDELTDMGLGAVILPLHGDLSFEEQQRCFLSYDQPKVVVSTNVAQTSITIPDIDAVVDSGLERRIELTYGIEGLYLLPVSQADCQQRKGRAGRTKAGVYILCADKSLAQRPEFPKAEIERVRLDQLVLRLASVDIDATQLTFFHQPERETITEAKRALIALGALDKDDQITNTGRSMSKLPISVQFARMVVEAIKRNVVKEVITIAAILEAGTLRDRDRLETWRSLTNERESDLLAELDLWKKAEGKRAPEMREIGIFPKNVFRAREIRNKLVEVLRNNNVDVESTGDRHEVLMSCIAGMVDHLYKQMWSGYKNSGDTIRQIDEKTVLWSRPGWLVGFPKDIQVKDRWGGFNTINLVSMVTKVDPLWLLEIAPHLAEQIHKDLCEGLWQTWSSRGAKPLMEKPDPEQDSSFIPDITEFVYGIDPMTQENLRAYGTVAVLIGDSFWVRWCRTFEAAEKERMEAVELLERKKRMLSAYSVPVAVFTPVVERVKVEEVKKDPATAESLSALAARFNEK